jgi:hypothetical protein
MDLTFRPPEQGTESAIFDRYRPPFDLTSDMLLALAFCPTSPLRQAFPETPFLSLLGWTPLVVWFSRITEGWYRDPAGRPRLADEGIPYNELNVLALLRAPAVFVPGIYASSELSVRIGHGYGMPKQLVPVDFGLSRLAWPPVPTNTATDRMSLPCSWARDAARRGCSARSGRCTPGRCASRAGPGCRPWCGPSVACNWLISGEASSPSACPGCHDRSGCSRWACISPISSSGCRRPARLATGESATLALDDRVAFVTGRNGTRALLRCGRSESAPRGSGCRCRRTSPRLPDRKRRTTAVARAGRRLRRARGTH